MKARKFALQPFPGMGRCPLIITGSINRVSHILAVRYAVCGLPADVLIPPPAELPDRRHGLWQETCFEFFLALKTTPGYWEGNLSPAGHWNVYRFSDYREGMQEEATFATLPYRVETQADRLTLALECSLKQIIPPDQPLEVAVSAVIKHADGRVTYWALDHTGPHPDFHRRESFIIEI